jgi:signal peptidase I
LFRALKVIRGAFRVLWIAGMLVLVSLVALPHVLGALDRQMYIVRGGSMTPQIPIGAMVVTHEVDATAIRAGDVITFRVGTGNVVTHRVTQVTGDSQLAFETKGDANDTEDAVPVPADAVLGRVELDVPTLGFVVNALASTAGMVVILGIFGTLLIGGWFIDELAATVVGTTRRVGEQPI